MKLILKDTNVYPLPSGLTHIASIESVGEGRIITRSGARTFLLMVDERSGSFYIEEEGLFDTLLIENKEEWEEVMQFAKDKGLLTVKDGDNLDDPKVQILLRKMDPKRFMMG